MPNMLANWWDSLDNDEVACKLCPKLCRIKPDKFGFCKVRKNIDGKLYSLVYGYPSAINIDPIEKKPFKHFLQGTQTFSLGTVACNFTCTFCQNSTLSQARKIPKSYYSPEDIVQLAQTHNCKSIAFTYNEPTIWAEYAMDIAKLARKESLKTVCVTNGYISAESAKDFYANIDAANVDLKAFSNDFYKKLTSASLKPVLNTLKLLKKMDVHIEITNLVIPDENESREEVDLLLKWVKNELGEDVPLHFSAFFPHYKMMDKEPTSLKTLLRIREQAYASGMKNIYLGNV